MGRLCVVDELIANSATLRDKRSDALLELTFYLFSFLGLAVGELSAFPWALSFEGKSSFIIIITIPDLKSAAFSTPERLTSSGLPV